MTQLYFKVNILLVVDQNHRTLFISVLKCFQGVAVLMHYKARGNTATVVLKSLSHSALPLWSVRFSL